MNTLSNLDKPTEKTPNPWPLGGYAPGGYSCHCSQCQAAFVGDKRANQCLACAVQEQRVALDYLKSIHEPKETKESTCQDTSNDEVTLDMVRAFVLGQTRHKCSLLTNLRKLLTPEQIEGKP